MLSSGFGCIGAITSGGTNVGADVGCGLNTLLHVLEFFSKSKFPWIAQAEAECPALGRVSYSLRTGALGLPSPGGCEFGACGSSYTGPNTSGAYPNGGDPADLNLFGGF